MADFALLESPKLISRKIWVIEKSWNFHTVNMYLHDLFCSHFNGIVSWGVRVQLNKMPLLSIKLDACSENSLQHFEFLLVFGHEIGGSPQLKMCVRVCHYISKTKSTLKFTTLLKIIHILSCHQQFRKIFFL